MDPENNIASTSQPLVVAQPRRSSRETKRKRISLEEQDEDQSKVETRAPPAKRKRTQKLGKLAELMIMPMDVLFEIFGHLRPLDLLHLSRTTKEFRRVLMHRSAMSVWKSARTNVAGLPDCPSFMSEPHFANLVFDTHCHECLAPHIRSVDWRIGRRICMRCSKNCMIEEYPGTDPMYAMVPSKYSKRGRPSYYQEEVTEVQNKLASFTNMAERDLYIKERKEYVMELGKYATKLDLWARTQAKDRSEQLDDARRDRKEAIIEKLTALGWGYEIEKIPYRDDLSLHKLVKQPTRLTERIWKNIRAEMIKYMEQMKTQRLERERKALIVERKKIAISVLKDYKIAHLPVVDIMPEPVDFCAFPEVAAIVDMPTEVTITKSSFNSVVDILDQLIDNWRSRLNEELVSKVREHIASNAPSIPEDNEYNFDDEGHIISRNKGKNKASSPPIPSKEEIVHNIKLATTVFKCRNCAPHGGLNFPMFDYPSDSDEDDEDDFMSLGMGLYAALFRRNSDRTPPLFYPKVMGHRCLTKQKSVRWDSSMTDPIATLDYPMMSRTKWSCKSLRIDERASKVVEELVKVAGLNPLTTTATEMDELDARFACGQETCLTWGIDSGDEAEAPVFDWRNAVKHHCSVHHTLDANEEWELLEGEALEDVKKSEEHSPVPPYFLGSTQSNDPSVWICAHCLDLPQEKSPMDIGRIKAHITNFHHTVEQAEENRDYFRDYEAPKNHNSSNYSRLTTPIERSRPDGHYFSPMCDSEEDSYMYGYDDYPDYDLDFY